MSDARRSADPLATAWAKSEVDLDIARHKLCEATDDYEKARRAYEKDWKAYRQSMESEVGA